MPPMNEFKQLYAVLVATLDNELVLELRAQRALSAVLEHRLATSKRHFWLMRSVFSPSPA